MKTPAMTNQYGDMYTGMPNRRAMTIPGPPARRCGFSGFADDWSGVRLATSRCYVPGRSLGSMRAPRVRVQLQVSKIVWGAGWRGGPYLVVWSGTGGGPGR